MENPRRIDCGAKEAALPDSWSDCRPFLRVEGSGGNFPPDEIFQAIKVGFHYFPSVSFWMALNADDARPGIDCIGLGLSGRILWGGEYRASLLASCFAMSLNA
jgi:hypothetical protein